MTNKSSKIIFLLLIPIFVGLSISYIQKKNQLEWRDVNGFELKITGDIGLIEEFYTSLEPRLMGYPDWINIVLTGELSEFQKDYAPFRISINTFENYNKIFTSTNMTRLLAEYSNYLERMLLENQENNSQFIESELKRLFQFISILRANFVKSDNVFIEDIIDIMKFDINPYFEPINKTHTIYIYLHENNNIHSKLKDINNQIEMEVNELTELIDVDVSITKRDLQIASIDTLDLLGNYQAYNGSQYSHIYKYLPLMNYTEFYSRIALMKARIYKERNSVHSTAAEFLIILSKIEEQLIEFQFRENFQNSYTLKLINRLVGNGVTESGILTSMINLLNDKRYRYLVDDYLTKSSKYLKNEIKNIPELTYPTIQSLPNKLLSKYTDGNLTIILKVK